MAIKGRSTASGNHTRGFGPEGLKEQGDARAAASPKGRSPKLTKGIKTYRPK